MKCVKKQTSGNIQHLSHSTFSFFQTLTMMEETRFSGPIKHNITFPGLSPDFRAEWSKQQK